MQNLTNHPHSYEEIPSEEVQEDRKRNLLRLKSPNRSKQKYFPLQKTVLVIDDNEMNRFVLCEMLKIQNIPYIEGQNGQDALNTMKKLFQEPIQKVLILMDLELPVIDGIEATKKILKVKPDNYPLYIIAVTAYSSLSQRILCEEAKINYFLEKPLNYETLLKVINKYLS